MDEDFITDGLAESRYLKAEKLAHRFRTQIRAELEATFEKIIDSKSDLFSEDVQLDYGFFGVENSKTLTTIRIEANLESEHERYGTRMLNLGLEWVDPEAQETAPEAEKPLCYVLYKIQRGSDDRFRTVEDRTRSYSQWDAIRFGDDQWPYSPKEAPGIVYIPVNDGSEIVAGLQTLRNHFEEVYAPLFRDG